MDVFINFAVSEISFEFNGWHIKFRLVYQVCDRQMQTNNSIIVVEQEKVYEKYKSPH